MRWLAPDGQVWASRFEYGIFVQLKEQGFHVRKTDLPDQLDYTDPVHGGRCLDCGSSSCVTARHYTPDLFVGPAGTDLDTGAERVREGHAPSPFGYYIEAKGYLRADRRSLLRSVRKAWPRLDFRLVVQRDYRVTAKLTIVEWARKFLKCEVHVWNGSLPKEWKL
jgi:hypothetical protein